MGLQSSHLKAVTHPETSKAFWQGPEGIHSLFTIQRVTYLVFLPYNRLLSCWENALGLAQAVSSYLIIDRTPFSPFISKVTSWDAVPDPFLLSLLIYMFIIAPNFCSMSFALRVGVICMFLEQDFLWRKHQQVC